MNTPQRPLAAIGRLPNRGAIALLSVFVCVDFFPLDAHADITVTEGSITRSDFTKHFYGANGQDRVGFDWTQTKANGDGNTFKTVLGSMNYGILRFPCGTDADYWDWVPGTDSRGSVLKASPLSELKNELNESGAVGDFVLNMATYPPTGTDDNVGGPTVSGQGQYQLKPTTGLFATAQNTSVGIAFVELGNELYAHDSAVTAVYPGSTPAYTYYGTLANNWISNVHGQGAYQVAAVAADRSLNQGDPRRYDWNWGTDGNSGLFNKLSWTNADAVTIHIYPEPNLAPNAAPPMDDGTNGKAEQLIGSVFLNWKNVEADDFGSDGFQIPKSVPAWVTEYNLDSQAGILSYCGSWAHGLAVGAMSLKFLEEAQIKMLVHHCVVANAGDGDIFESTDGLSGVSNPNGWTTPPATMLFGLTATGVVMKHINTAAAGQTNAQVLTFSGFTNGSTYSPPNNLGSAEIDVPRLYGWEFTGSGSPQAIILNLDNATHTIDLSFAKSATYTQISGYPAVYVTDGINQKAYNYEGVESDLVLTSGSTTTITLPEFSITRISYTHK